MRGTYGRPSRASNGGGLRSALGAAHARRSPVSPSPSPRRRSGRRPRRAPKPGGPFAASQPERRAWYTALVEARSAYVEGKAARAREAEALEARARLIGVLRLVVALG